MNSRKARVIAAWILLVGSVIAWPVAALTWARKEPQFVLGLSFLAIILTAWDILTTSQVHEEQGENGSGSDGKDHGDGGSGPG